MGIHWRNEMRTKLTIAVLAIVAASNAFAGASVIGYSVMSNGDDHLYEINFTTGMATDLGLVNFEDAEGMAMSVGGTIYAGGGTVQELWDITTPPGSLIGSMGTLSGVDAGMDFHSNGTLYLASASASSTELYTVNTATGAAISVGTGDYFGDNLAISDAGIAYAADFIFSNELYMINLATGAETLIGGLGIAPFAQAGTDFGADGFLYALLSNGDWYTLNTGTGAATLGGTIRNATGAPLSGWEGLAMNPVPEPGTIIAIAAGLGLLVARRRRK
jgi:hypothetical protein